MEEWKDIPGYEGLYQASRFGQIRSCEGKTTSNARFANRVWKQRILKQKRTKNRYNREDCRVSLWKEGKEKTMLVARLVAMAFCDGYSDGMTVNHIDGNPLNNRASNLEWCSLAENIRKGYKDGLYSTTKRISLIDCNGIEHMFASQAEASRFLGKNSSYLALKISRNKLTLPDGYVIKLTEKQQEG